MTSNGKRQRRSYSCGPCKVLKIKCDLQLPCASCTKFKREDKCYEAPPQPPTESELLVIQERKERMSKRKRISIHNGNATLNPISQQIQLATQMPILAINANFQFITNSPNKFVIEPTFNKHVIYKHPEGPMYPTITSFAGPNAVAPTNFIDLLQQFPDNDNPYQEIEDFFKRKKMDFSFEDREWNTLAMYYFPSGENVCEQDVIKDSQIVSEIDVEDSNFLKLTFPSPQNVCRLFVGHFKSFKEDLFGVLDYATFFKFTLRIGELVQNNEYNQPLVLSSFQHRLLSIALPLLTSGLIIYPNLLLSTNYTNNDICGKWILLSKKFKERFKKTDSLFDIVYLMLWYFTIDNYYYQRNMLVENHFEYNSLLSNLLFNKTHMTYIIDRRLDFTKLEGDKLVEFKIIAKLWLKLRAIELNVLYFQYKSSLLQSNKILKYSLIPNDTTLRFLYGENFIQIEDDITRGLHELAKEYFNRFDSVGDGMGSKREIIESYLTVYASTFKTVGYDIRLFENEIKNGKIPEINYNTMLFYYRSQYYLLVNVKWLTLVNMEIGYFPSLRYTLYLTSMLTIINHYIYLDEVIDKASAGQNCLLKELGKAFSFHPLESVFYSIVILQFFLIFLKSHISDDSEFNESRILNLQKLYETIDVKYQKFFIKFKNDFNATEVRHIPLYRNSMIILNDLNIMQKDMAKNTFFKVEKFIQVIKNKLQTPDLFIDLFFGCPSTMRNYIRKLVYLCEYLNSRSKQDTVAITSEINFTEELILQYQDSFTGFTMDSDTVKAYLNAVVDPIIDSRESSE